RTTGDANDAMFPARSVTDTLPLTAAPSAVSSSGLGIDVDATPDSASSGVNGSATSVRFQPFAFGAGSCARYCSVGGVKSRRMPPRVSDAVLPALSVHVCVALCASPSPETMRLSAGSTMPDSASVHDQPTDTGVLFQPY